MKIIAKSKYIRMSPRKLRLVADLVRKMELNQALISLKHLQKKAATPLAKVLKQAQANALTNFQLDKKSLKIDSIEVNVGPIYKRWQPVAKGRANPIFKRTSHIKVVLEASSAGDKHGTKS